MLKALARRAILFAALAALPTTLPAHHYAPAAPAQADCHRQLEAVADDTDLILPPVMGMLVVGDHVCLLHAPGSEVRTTTVPLDALQVVHGSSINSWGFPGLSVVSYPHVLSTTWASTMGTHTVTTPCRNYNTILDCARAHRAALRDMQIVFPPV